jgi:hypothetical protein
VGGRHELAEAAEVAGLERAARGERPRDLGGDVARRAPCSVLIVKTT